MKRWTEVSPYSGIEEDAPANNASSGDVSMPPDAVMDKKKKKRDALFDARTRAYREHRAKLEAARERRAAKESKFVKKVTSEMAYGAGYDNKTNGRTECTEVFIWIRTVSQGFLKCHATCIQVCKEQGIHCTT